MDAAVKVVVDIQNREEIANLTKKIDLQKEAVSALNQQLKLGVINQQQFNAATAPMGQTIAGASARIKELEHASGSAGRGLSQLSYAVDDIQYGFNAIVNNIPQIVMGLGGGAGIAGAIGIAAVAVNQLIKHWGDLTAALQGAWEGSSPERLKTLAEQAEEAAKAFDKLAESASKAKKAEAGDITELVTEKGAENLAGNLAQRIGMDPGLRAEMTQEEKNSLNAPRGAQMTGPGALPAARGDPAIIQKRLEQENLKKARELIGQASIAGPKGDQARLQLRRLDPDIATDVAAATPEWQEHIQQWRLDAAGRRQGRKQEEKAADDAKKFGQQEKDEWLHGVGEAQKHLDAKRKQDAINAIEDERTLLLERHHQDDLMLERMKAQLGHGSQTLSGPKAVSDYYMKAAADSPLVALAKATKDIQEQQREELKKINAKLEVERRVRPQN